MRPVISPSGAIKYFRINSPVEGKCLQLGCLCRVVNTLKTSASAICISGKRRGSYSCVQNPLSPFQGIFQDLEHGGVNQLLGVPSLPFSSPSLPFPSLPPFPLKPGGVVRKLRGGITYVFPRFGRWLGCLSVRIIRMNIFLIFSLLLGLETRHIN